MYFQGDTLIVTTRFVPNLRRDLELVDDAKAFLQSASVKKKSEISDDHSIKQGSNLRIAFVTDRNPENSSDWKSSFGDKMLVSRVLRCGEVGTAAYDGREVGQMYDERKIFVNVNGIITGKDSCAEYVHDEATVEGGPTLVDEQTRPRTSGNILVLLHGYNNNFGDTIRAVAFAQDVDFNGLLLVWSWPSTGWKYAYKHDVAASDYSSLNFVNFFQQLMAKDPSLHIDYIAHSMGGRILLKFLFDIRGEPSAAYATFAAPDIDSGQFRNQASAARVPLLTLYASAYDSALMASQIYNAAPSPRAGAGGNDIIVLPGMDSIDVNLGGHSYVFDHP
jgi:esterase/lipase superfamily enzyme